MEASWGGVGHRTCASANESNAAGHTRKPKLPTGEALDWPMHQIIITRHKRLHTYRSGRYKLVWLGTGGLETPASTVVVPTEYPIGLRCPPRPVGSAFSPLAKLHVHQWQPANARISPRRWLFAHFLSPERSIGFFASGHQLYFSAQVQ